MRARWIVISLCVCGLGGCKPQKGGARTSQQAIKVLGSVVLAPQFDRNYWRRERDANPSAWGEAKRLCEETVITNYPNCLPINDLVEAEQRKNADAGNIAAEKVEEMFRRGYQFDDVRKAWLPFREMQAAGCIYSYPRAGATTWQCPPGTAIPKGIPDPNFSMEEK